MLSGTAFDCLPNSFHLLEPLTGIARRIDTLSPWSSLCRLLLPFAILSLGASAIPPPSPAIMGHVATPLLNAWTVREE
jgi:hypothetical protein